MLQAEHSERLNGWCNSRRIRRVASQTQPMQECHPERSEGSLSAERSFAALRACPRAKRRDDIPEAASFDSQNVFFEMYCAQALHSERECVCRTVPSHVSPKNVY